MFSAHLLLRYVGNHRLLDRSVTSVLVCKEPIREDKNTIGGFRDVEAERSGVKASVTATAPKTLTKYVLSRMARSVWELSRSSRRRPGDVSC